LGQARCAAKTSAVSLTMPLAAPAYSNFMTMSPISKQSAKTLFGLFVSIKSITRALSSLPTFGRE
jgi:hypothetical protein